MVNQPLIDLITKELTNAISAEEFKELQQLLENSENKTIYEGLKSKWVTSGKLTTKHKPNTEASWQKIKTSIDQSQTKVINIRSIFYKVAAVLVIGIGLGYFYFQNQNLAIEYFTKKGEVKEITLPDNSKIWLNESSYLAYDDTYNTELRKVILNGEAFFEIEKNLSKPFIVISNEAKTEVLGTSFNILAYDDQEFVEIDVNSGKVSFSEIDTDENKVLLVKGESARYDVTSTSLSKMVKQSQNYASWKTKQLNFDDAKLSDVVTDLSDYFNQNIQLKSGEMASCRFTSQFSNPTIEEVLEVLKFTLNITTKQTETGITLNGQGC